MAKKPRTAKKKTIVNKALGNRELLNLITHDLKTISFLGDIKGKIKTTNVKYLKSLSQGKISEGVKYLCVLLNSNLKWGFTVSAYFKVPRLKQEIDVITINGVYTYDKGILPLYELGEILGEIIKGSLELAKETEDYYSDNNLFYYWYSFKPQFTNEELDHEADLICGNNLNLLDIDALEPFKGEIPGLISDKNAFYSGIAAPSNFKTPIDINYRKVFERDYFKESL